MTDPTNDQSVPPVPPAPQASGDQPPVTPAPVTPPPAYTPPSTPPAYTAPQPSTPDAPAAPEAPPAYGQPAAYGAPAAYGQPDPAQPGYAPTYSAVPPAAPKTLSLIGMIAGIVGVVAFGYFLPASIAALILGYMGKKREGLAAKGFWLTAIITGWIGVGITVIGGIGLIALFVLAGVSSSGY